MLRTQCPNRFPHPTPQKGKLIEESSVFPSTQGNRLYVQQFSCKSSYHIYTNAYLDLLLSKATFWLASVLSTELKKEQSQSSATLLLGCIIVDQVGLLHTQIVPLLVLKPSSAEIKKQPAPFV